MSLFEGDILKRNDAILEADSWKKTAAKWRKRFLQDMSGWKKRAREVIQQRDDLRAEVEALRPFEASCRAKDLEIAKLTTQLNGQTQELRELYARPSQEDLEKKIRSLEVEAALLSAAAARAKEDKAWANERVESSQKASESLRKDLDGAHAALRVVAVRLGIVPSGTFDPKTSHDLAGKIDSAVLALQKRAALADSD